ncbi:unnamed protein product [Ceratitis capitata]|uniref:Protein aurora borealis n=1 Tax=Ceratitis capitata TaxID=7213 RepID=W8CBE5_CERCA|nr:unnamed protein product [Ceratitis capitata]
MEFEKNRTPLKMYSTLHVSGIVTHKVGNESIELVRTPGGGRCHKKMLHPRTPSKTINCNISAISSVCGNSAKQILYSAAMSTPPAKRFHRIKNPFEPVLADRLHLPLIASPSLFQRPTTPQLSSTQFEWNIDEVSSLKPANVEPHETQFHDSPDPDYEAKAQSAISSYFKDNQIVPSPVDCQLRSQRIILSELNSNTPITKPGRRIRDCGTQTELTLPFILPPDLEEALMPYFHPQLALADRYNCEIEAQIRFSSESNMSISNDAKDVSLRRKLFDLNNIVVLDEAGTPTTDTKSITKHPNSSPTSNGGNSRDSGGNHFAIVGKLSDSMDKSSFGSLSPISASDGLSNSPHSPIVNPSGMKSRMQNFLQELSDAEQLSPIHPPVRQTSRRGLDKTQFTNKSQQSSKDSYRCQELNQSGPATLGDASLANMDGVIEKFTPDRSSSPLRLNYYSNESETANGHLSIDSSFNMKISRLAVNSSKSIKQRPPCIGKTHEYDVFANDDTQELIEDDDMQVSQLSVQNCSSSSSTDTPRSKKRSASRKNLSQSFSLNWLDDEELGEGEQRKEDKDNFQKIPIDVPRIDIKAVDELIVREHELQQQQQMTKHALHVKSIDVDKHNDGVDEQTRAVFYRVDSGFNEMPASGSCSSYSLGASQTYDSAHSPTKELDVSMVCCSTPSKSSNSMSVES